MSNSNEGNGLSRILWSIAFPGFGQLLNGQFLKGLMFIILEFLINVQSHLNEAIISSFLGDTSTSIAQINYQWLMFYPCIYVFAIYDAYLGSASRKIPYLFLPFVFAAYLATIGVIYSPIVRILGSLLGPIWLPMLCSFLGVGVGYFVRFVVIWFSPKQD